jgi:hypothetical protein
MVWRLIAKLFQWRKRNNRFGDYKPLVLKKAKRKLRFLKESLVTAPWTGSDSRKFI